MEKIDVFLLLLLRSGNVRLRESLFGFGLSCGWREINL